MMLEIVGQEKSTQDFEKIQKFLVNDGIDFGRFEMSAYARKLAKKDSPTEEERLKLIQSFRSIVDKFSDRNGYRADVVCFWPEFEHMDFILNKFGSIHYHFENEYWYFFDGHAIFGFLRKDGIKYILTVDSGHYLQVPEGRWQWFTVPAPRRMKAMRLFYTTGMIPQPTEILL